MSFLSKLMDTMRLNDDEEEDDDYFLDDEEYDDEEDKSSRKGFFRRDADDGFAGEEPNEPQRPRFLPRAGSSGKVVPMRRGMQVILMKPVSMDDAKQISDNLSAGMTVVLNMEGVNGNLTQRVIDFTSGATYAMQGHLQKVSNYIFIAVPQSVQLTGEFEDVLAEGGIDVSGLNLHL